MQSRRRSVAESLTNIVIGIVLSWLAMRWVLTLNLSANEATTLTTALCTLWSFIRSYFIRRFFNWMDQQ